jgi:hypothetical protein
MPLINAAVEKRTDFLKLIAALTMLLDHAASLPGIANSNTYIILRIIGRISFPIFAYYIAVGFIHTHNLKKYVTRLFICAVISQIPFALYFKDPFNLNIIFTFLLAIAVLYFLKIKWHYTAVVVSLLPVCTQILFNIGTDYSTYGILTVAVFYLFMHEEKKAGIAFIVLTVLFSVCISSYVQLFSISALPVIYLKHSIKIKMPKYFFYYFYPSHIMILYILSILFIKS